MLARPDGGSEGGIACPYYRRGYVVIREINLRVGCLTALLGLPADKSIPRLRHLMGLRPTGNVDSQNKSVFF